jgi:hypothetical protein
MKKTFLLMAILFSLQSFSQQPYYDFKTFKYKNRSGLFLPFDMNKRDQLISKDSLARLFKALQQQNYSPAIGDLVFTYPNGNKMYALPQDHMPCIVPDHSQFNMPNAGTGIKITGMPPGSVPRKPYFVPKE